MFDQEKCLNDVDEQIRQDNLSYVGSQLNLNVRPRSLSIVTDTPISRILVLYTGGTIGMRCVDGVYKPQANYFCESLRKIPMFHDSAATFHHFPNLSSSGAFTMPLFEHNRRVVFVVHEYNPLLDSSDMTMDDWIRIAKDIHQEYVNYDGFVVLHGTDTMAYSASAISFLLDNLGKPVVITGSQIPIFETRSDGRDNLLGALILSSHFCVPEVVVYFHNKVYRGNRVTKHSTSHLDAFDSPNYPIIAEFGTSIHVYSEHVFQWPSKGRFHVHTELSPNVAVLRLFPSITKSTIDSFLQSPIEGIVLQTYGAGNIPITKDYLFQALKKASDRGAIIVNISQCPQGSVQALYAASTILQNAGVILGMDMTIEAALTKLAYVLSLRHLSVHEKRAAMGRSLRGELTQPNKLQNETFLQQLAESLKLPALKKPSGVGFMIVPALMCAAASYGDLDTLKDLGSTMGNYNIVDYDRRTPLHLAAIEGHVQIVQFLIQQNVDVNAVDRFGNTPLMNAARYHYHAIIQLLLSVKARLHMKESILATILNKAVIANDLSLLRSYYLAGASLQEQDDDAHCPLHIACIHCRDEILTFLLTNVRVPLHLKNKFGRTARDEMMLRQPDHPLLSLM